MNELFSTILETSNEILAAAIVIIAVSLLLYNVSRNSFNRVARSSGWVLAAVTASYLVDVFLALGPSNNAALLAARLQWFGLAFIPATLFHLSDALLATTGLPSRGRRRMVVRLLYVLSTIFVFGAIRTDLVAVPVLTANGIKLQAEPLFWVYFAYFITAMIVTFINVQRARKRCLTDSTRRRMTYLQIAILTPAIGIFPYSVFLPAEGANSLFVQLVVNTANIFVIIMLLFVSYPLSFFGSDVPDRVVKTELLRFLLRGPGTGLISLVVIIGTRQANLILSLSAEQFIPFAVVVVVMFWQWMIALALPFIERFLVYGDEDDEQLAKLQDLSERILTRNDLHRLINATLEAVCDFLRTEVAFVSSMKQDAIEVVGYVGVNGDIEEQIQDDFADLYNLISNADRVTERSAFQTWDDYQVIPLFTKRTRTNDSSPNLIGLLGIQLDTNPVNRIDEQDIASLYAYIARAEQSLDDLLLQDEIFAALEGLMPQFSMTRKRAVEVEYLPGRQKPLSRQLPSRDETYEQVRAALRHYWGGPGIARSHLLNLDVVQRELQEVDTPIQALRNVLQEALEKQKPDGERSITGTEWTLYNIVDLRFIEGKKVRDVARRMSISEPDLYRKQRLAIQAIADTLLEMEQESTISPS